jgi:hypothetical protein
MCKSTVACDKYCDMCILMYHGHEWWAMRVSTGLWGPLEQWRISIPHLEVQRRLISFTLRPLYSLRKSSQITKQAGPQKGLDMEAKYIFSLNKYKVLMNPQRYKRHMTRSKQYKIYKIPPSKMVWSCWKNAKPTNGKTNCNRYNGRNKEKRKTM